MKADLDPMDAEILEGKPGYRREMGGCEGRRAVTVPFRFPRCLRTQQPPRLRKWSVQVYS